MFSFKSDFDLTLAGWGWGCYICLKILFIQVLLNLYAKFQPSTMSGSGLKVCGGGGGGWWVVVGVETHYSVKLS